MKRKKKTKRRRNPEKPDYTLAYIMGAVGVLTAILVLSGGASDIGDTGDVGDDTSSY